MFDEHSTEQLEQESRKALQQEEPTEYTPRPKGQRILALVLAGIVVVGFLGTCYWLMFGKF